ncbi:isochorismatase family protein [Chloroflexota bacterium]
MRNKTLLTLPELIMLEAKPKPLEIDVQRMAIIIVDMQNAFISKGGLFDLRSFDLSESQKCIEPITNISSIARKKGIEVIYITHQLSSDLHELSPNSPYWYHEGVRYREKPEWRDKMAIHGTWGAAIVDRLNPDEGEIVVEKQRYSAFFATNLDMILKMHNMKYLVFTGVTTNICVEASIRDAFYLEYFPILISDATAAPGPPFLKDATIYNIEHCYGWVTTAANLARAMGTIKT